MGVQMCLYLKNCHDIRTESVIILTLNCTLHNIIDARGMAHCNQEDIKVWIVDLWLSYSCHSSLIVSGGLDKSCLLFL